MEDPRYTPRAEPQQLEDRSLLLPFSLLELLVLLYTLQCFTPSLPREAERRTFLLKEEPWLKCFEFKRLYRDGIIGKQRVCKLIIIKYLIKKYVQKLMYFGVSCR